MGSITIDTGFDLGGAEKGYKRLLELTSKTAKETAEAFGGTTAAIMKQQTIVDELKAKIQAISDIDAKAPTFERLTDDLKAAEIELEKLTADYEKAVALLTDLQELGLSDADLSVQVADVDRLAKQLFVAEDKAAALREKLTNLSMPEQPKENAEQLAAKLGIASQKLSEMQAKAAQVGKTAPKAMRDTGTAASKMGGTLAKTANRIKQLLVSVMVFNVLRKGFNELRDYIGLALKENKAFANSFAQVKANLATAFQPILQIVVPILATLMQWLAIATQYLVMFVSALTGKSIKSMQDAAKSMDKLKKSTAGAGAAAKKTLATFDEIQQLQDSSGGGGGATGEDGGIGGIAPDYDSSELEGKLADTIAAIMIILGGAFLVLGAILTFSGANIPLGLALIAMGALLIASAYTARWDSMDEQLKNTLAAIFIIVGSALLVLGVILAFSGANIPLGLGLIAVGAALLAAAYVAQWNSMDEQLKNTIAAIALIVGAELLILGVLLTFSGVNIPLGLALIAAGAVLLVAAYKAQWDSMDNQLKDVIASIAFITGTTLLVLGVILAFSGASIPLGIGLILAGATLLYTAYKAQWDSMDNQIKSTIGSIALIISASLLVLGAILAFSGASLPLGIALMALGAVGLVSAIALSWNSMSDELKATITTIALIVGAALLVLGAIFVFSGANIPLGIAMMLIGAAGLVSAIALGWDSLSTELKGTIAIVTTILSTALLVLGAIFAFTGANIPLGIAMMVIGAAGLVAAITASSQLTDDTRQTIATIAAIVGGALIALGIILLCFGVIPLGLALLVAGVGLIVAGIFASPGKDMLEKIKNFVNGIIGFFEGMANGVISIFEKLLNWVVDGLNTISFDIPDWVPRIGGNTFGFNISPVALGRVSIPRLATGTIVPPNKEFMAILGDNKQETEVVSPISTMKQALAEALAESGMGGNVIIEAHGNVDEIIRFFTFKIKAEQSRQGEQIGNREVFA